MRALLKRSGLLNLGKALEPQPENMAKGELAVNYNAKDPALFIKDSSDHITRLGVCKVEDAKETTFNAETDYILIQRGEEFFKVKASDIIS
jgi:hypothetical protein